MNNTTNSSVRPSTLQVFRVYTTFFFALFFWGKYYQIEGFINHLFMSVFVALISGLGFAQLYRVAPKIAIGTTLLLLLWAGKTDVQAQAKPLVSPKSTVSSVKKQPLKPGSPKPQKKQSIPKVSALLSKTALASVSATSEKQPVSQAAPTQQMAVSQTIQLSPLLASFWPNKNLLNPLHGLFNPDLQKTGGRIGVGLLLSVSGEASPSLYRWGTAGFLKAGLGIAKGVYSGKTVPQINIGGGVKLRPKFLVGIQAGVILDKVPTYRRTPTGGEIVNQTKPYLLNSIIAQIELKPNLWLSLFASPSYSRAGAGFGAVYFF